MTWVGPNQLYTTNGQNFYRMIGMTKETIIASILELKVKHIPTSYLYNNFTVQSCHWDYAMRNLLTLRSRGSIGSGIEAQAHVHNLRHCPAGVLSYRNRDHHLIAYFAGFYCIVSGFWTFIQ